MSLSALRSRPCLRSCVFDSRVQLAFALTKAPNLSRALTEGPTHKRNHAIWTLDPKQLTSADFLNLSDCSFSSISIQSTSAHGADGLPEPFKIWWYRRKQKNVRFPSDATGFLYFHRRPDLPITSASIRFRLSSSKDPSIAFTEGRDLLDYATQLPWEISIYRIIHSTFWWLPLRNHLLKEDRIISEEDTLPLRLHKPGISKTRPPFILHYIGQPFFVNFESETLKMMCFGDPDEEGGMKALRPVLFTCMFHKWSSPRKKWEPMLKGSAHIRFEICHGANQEEEPFIVMRVLKIISPVSSTAPSEDQRNTWNVPVEGQFIKRKGKVLKWHLWSASTWSALGSLALDKGLPHVFVNAGEVEQADSPT